MADSFTVDDKNPLQGNSKCLKSMAPDVMISVGNGDDMEEFECYSVILCSGSDYFDTMLNSPMKERETKRITFPDKDPKEWKLLYPFLDGFADNSPLRINNIMILLPWFHEFQMYKQLEECDSVVRDALFTTISSFSGPKEEKIERIISEFELSSFYDLPRTRKLAIKAMQFYLEGSNEWEHILQDVWQSFKPNELKRIINNLTDNEKEAASSWFWQLCEGTLRKDFEITSNRLLLKNELFTHLLYEGLYRTHSKLVSNIDDDV